MSRIEVRVEHSFIRRELKIWIYERISNDATMIHMINAEAKRHDNSLELPEPTLVIPVEFAEPLVTALSETIPPNHAMQNHLRDVMTVRDRILAMLENWGKK